MADFLDTLAHVAQHFSYENIRREIEELRNNNDDFQGVDIVVVGQFKAGKSSLINSLLQRSFLPVGVLPVTAIITRIRYGSVEKAMVTTLSGKIFEITIKELPYYITEKENPKNKKEVWIVDIFTPAMSQFANIRFIDTPGLGSAFQHNTEVTQNWYSRIGSAIVVMNTTQACSENDCELISTTLEYSPLVYLLLSKADLTKKEDLSEVVGFVRNKCKEYFGKELGIFPYSIEKEADQRRETLQKEILLPLNKNHTDAKRSIYNHKLSHLKALTLSYLNISLSVCEKEQSERNSLKNKIIDEQLRLDYVQRELRLIARSYLEKTRETLEIAVIEKYKKTLSEAMIDDFETHFETWKGNLNRVSRHYEKWLKKSTASHLRKIETETRPFANELSSKAGNHFANYCTSFRDRLNQNLEKVLGVSMAEDEFVMEVQPVEKPDIMTSWAFESHLDLLWFLIPMVLLRNYFKNHFKRQLPSEAEKNLYRLTAQLTKNINRSIEEAHVKSLQYITGQLHSIEHLLSEKNNDKEEIMQFIEKIEGASMQK